MNFNGVRVCGVPDNVGTKVCKWPISDLTVYAAGKLGEVDVLEAVRFATDAWSKVCGINFVFVSNPKTAHLVVTQSAIDGPFGTLGVAELPCGFSSGAIVNFARNFDSAEIWALSLNPPRGRIDAGRVFRHEFGHLLGIPHLMEGNLMQATYSDDIIDLQRGDELEALSRYPITKPRPDTPPPAPPPMSGPFRSLIVTDEAGQQWRGGVDKWERL
ncbi:MAG: matrixin family metalloprotease [Pirellulales bacterium]